MRGRVLACGACWALVAAGDCAASGETLTVRAVAAAPFGVEAAIVWGPTSTRAAVAMGLLSVLETDAGRARGAVCCVDACSAGRRCPSDGAALSCRRGA